LNIDINEFEAHVRSRNGEDGIIKELLFRIGAAERYAVDVGFGGDGASASAHLLLDYDWRGLIVEGDAVRAQAAGDLMRERPVAVHQEPITAENIAAIFASHHVPLSPDLLSIAIDGNDYWVWKALAGYRPRVVVIDYNAAYQPPERWVMEYDPGHTWKGDTHRGASLASLTILGRELGYALLGTASGGARAFFIRRDLRTEAGFPEVRVAAAYRPGAIAYPYAGGASQSAT
jgi:hypothetical protein